VKFFISFFIIFSFFYVGYAFGCPQKKGKIDIYSAEGIERDLLELINKERKEHGYRPLLLHPSLNNVALHHSLKMAKERKLSHIFPGYRTLQHRLMDTGLYFLESGENIAFSQSIVGKYIHRKFMKSLGHRQNILDPAFTHCGIKLAPLRGDFYVTQVFARLYTPLKEEEMEKRLERAFKILFQEAYNKQLIFFTQLKPYARIASKLNARGKKIDVFLKSLPDEWGEIDVINLISPQLEKIEAEFRKVMMEKKYSGAAVGVSLTRGQEFPGGAYSVSVFLLDLVYGKWTKEEFAQLLLEEINRVRRKNGFQPLKMDKKKFGSAIPLMEISSASRKRRFQAQVERVRRRIGRSRVQVFTFSAHDPRKLPVKVQEALVGNRDAPEKIAILVYLPITHGFHCNYFEVTLIF